MHAEDKLLFDGRVQAVDVAAIWKQHDIWHDRWHPRNIGLHQASDLGTGMEGACLACSV